MTGNWLLLIPLAAAIAGLLVYARSRYAPDEATAVETINALLPQTQCAQCGYPGCRPYAEALVNDAADINLCPPGGETTLQALSKLLGRPAGTLAQSDPWAVAVINEADCIGCALCLPACPVDAIVGANRYTHTVIEADCTGCELCVPACPVDCIQILRSGQAPFAIVQPAKPGLRA